VVLRQECRRRAQRGIKHHLGQSIPYGQILHPEMRRQGQASVALADAGPRNLVDSLESLLRPLGDFPCGEVVDGTRGLDGMGPRLAGARARAAKREHRSRHTWRSMRRTARRVQGCRLWTHMESTRVRMHDVWECGRVRTSPWRSARLKRCPILKEDCVVLGGACRRGACPRAGSGERGAGIHDWCGILGPRVREGDGCFARAAGT